MDESLIYKPQNEVGFLVHLCSKHRRFLKRTLVFFVTISVFSIFVCLSSGFSLLPNSYYVYFNTCLFSILTHTFERKYMFLVCNGILAFLAKSSSCYYYSVPSNNYTPLPSFDPQLPFPTTLYSSSKPPLVSDLHLANSIQEQEQELGDKDEEEDGNKGEVMDHKENEDEEEDGNKGEVMDHKENEDEGEDEEQVSTEELNRRIEEFIRKMKQDIRIESQQQLIAV